MTAPAFAEVASEYARLWKQMTVRPDKLSLVDAAARRLIAAKDRYRAVETATGVPWFIIAAIHERESGANFHTHLHNGDPLSARTHHVPAGRPLNGNPPFTWEASAADALHLAKLDQIKSWPIERAAYELELYNGFGYRRHGINSPYLWSFSNNYQQGKYVADGQWSAGAVDRQCGTMPMLRRMMALDSSISFGAPPPSTSVPSVPPAPSKKPAPVPVPATQPWWLRLAAFISTISKRKG